MEREAMKALEKWKASSRRKPLLLKGIRQVGKTWLLREFGRQAYENVAYFNFDENEEYKQFFQTTKNTRRILENLMVAGGQGIRPQDTLVIFDEIQECPEALNSLKYFCENAAEYHIACAGSLLGVLLASGGFPVGKVDFLEVYPMTFREFLQANGDSNLADYLANRQEIEPLPDAFFNPLYEKLKIYFLTGGMPESVLSWAENHSIEDSQVILKNIIAAYERDFSKHPDRKEFPKLLMTWQSLPSQLSRENKKFLYRVIKEGARARDYEDAIGWLVSAGLIHKVYRSSAPRLPLSAYDDLSAFKLYAADVGLLRRLSNLSPSAFREENRLFTEFKGALTENFILQSLITQFEAIPRYWSRINPSQEVDFLVQLDNSIIPIEVKASKNVRSHSLKKYQETFPAETPLKVRFSLENLKLDKDVLNIPLFMADEARRIITMALNGAIDKNL